MVLFLRNKRFNVMLCWADYYLRWWRLPFEEHACCKTDLRNSGLPPSSRPITAFATVFGLYQFARMPFGLKNAGATYCRFVQILVDILGVPGIVAYLDDFLIHSADLNSYVNLLGLVFSAHKEAGTRLNASKTHLFQEEVEYLSHLVSAEGIKLIPSYVQKITDWPLPLTGKELSAFLGFTNYY